MAGQLPAWLDELGRKAEAAFGDPQRATRRPGSHLLLTAAQWDIYDQWTALQERMKQLGGAAEMDGGLPGTRGRMLL